MQASDDDLLLDRDPDDGPDGDGLAENPGNPKRKTGSQRSHQRVIRWVWNPEPIKSPTVDPELPKMPWPERCAEAIRYAFLRGEHWLSRQGVLREWLRINLWVGVALLAASLLVVPPVTMLLTGVAEWSGLIETTVLNVTATVLGLPPIVIAIGTLLIAARLLTRRWQARRSRRRYQNHEQNDPYD
jgi:hypothetical protein